MALGLIAVGLLAAVAGFGYLNKRAEVAAAKADFAWAHDKISALEANVRQVAANISGVVKKDVAAELAKVREVIVKHL